MFGGNSTTPHSSSSFSNSQTSPPIPSFYTSPTFPPPHYQYHHWPTLDPAPQSSSLDSPVAPGAGLPDAAEAMDEPFVFVCQYGRYPLPGEQVNPVQGPSASTDDQGGSRAGRIRQRMFSSSSYSSSPHKDSSPSPPARSRQPSTTSTTSNAGSRPSTRPRYEPWKTRCECPGGPPRTHPERHWRNSCPSNPKGSAKLRCPECSYVTSGRRKDNLQRHLDKKHNGMRLE